MRGRDVFILAAVLLIGGFAVADAIRSEAEAPRRTTEAEGRTTTSVVTTTPVPEDLGEATFPTVAEAGGSLVLIQPGSCAVREFDLPSGLEFANVVSRSSCELWAAPVSGKVAIGIGEVSRDAVPFRFVDLNRPQRNLGGSRAFFGFLIWSEDGQRAAWCTRPTRGFDQELGGPSRPLGECPAAYTPDGEIAYARGNQVIVEERRIALRASGAVTFVHYGSDGSVAVVVEGRRIERWVGGSRRQTLDLPPALRGRNPVFAPDNCAVIFRLEEGLQIANVGCSTVEEASFPGMTAGDWSPDGRWIAVGGPTRVVFHDLEGGTPVTWPVGAAALAWRR
ncbi:MAG TPA: hypothetical protein VHF23_05035 [Gaiellaceae bacterium]|nr:hypothetical protein [Gaiellaceae bacterium]